MSPLLLAVFAGAVLLDTVYANLLGRALDPALTAGVFAEASDFLLKIGFLVVIAAFAAIVLSWGHPPARLFFIAGLLVLIGFEFLLPAALLPILNRSPVFQSFGSSIRIAVNLIAVALTFLGLRRWFRPAND